MIKSEPILPLRIYNDIFDQHRFETLGPETEKPCLVYPLNDLPSFQFTRTSNLFIPSVFYLKNVCDDQFTIHGNTTKFQKQIPIPADTFNEPIATSFYNNYPPPVLIKLIGGGTTTNFPFTKLNCGNLVPNDLPAGYEYDDTFAIEPNFSFSIDSDTQKYKLKIIVEKYSSSLLNPIKIYNGDTSGVEILSISAAGEYEIEFVSTSTEITVCFLGFVLGDDFAISFLQCQNIDYSIIPSNSIELNASDLKIFQIKNGSDIITYCNKDQINISPGYYYYIVVDENETFFSEVFEIRYIKAMEGFSRLKWLNSCDINDTIICNKDTLDCDFYHTLYIDNFISNPQYETVDDGEQNGDQDTITTFKRWQKNITFESYKSAPFITDALTAIFMYDTILLRSPLNRLQDSFSNEYKIISIKNEVTDIIDDFYQSVKLTCVLIERYTSSSCCNGSQIITCPPSIQYDAATTCGAQPTQIIIHSPAEADDGLFDCITGDRINLSETDIILNHTDGFYYSFVFTGGVWVSIKYPQIIAINNDTEFYYIQGKILPWTFSEIYYNKNGAGFIALSYVQAGEFGDFKNLIPVSLVTGSSSFTIKVLMKTIGCDIIYSEISTII
jgi:hypothetical protein